MQINYGVRLVVNLSSKKSFAVYEFITKEQLSADYVKKFYSKTRLAQGKNILPCTINCSNFLGTSIIKVEIV